GLYYHFGVEKLDLPKKLFGIYKHRILKPNSPFFRGFNDEFLAPHSRATDVRLSDVEAIPELEVMAVTKEGSLAIAKTTDSRQIFVTCHAEYDRDTLAKEYWRDMEKGLTTVDVPVNYFPDDDPKQDPLVTWRSTGQLLYSNWLNFYVYQSTPFDLNAI
ncbi:MAG: homoserine O-succinyltransferase, partial [Lachnospiraceae bacterium]|nr:homoserine O-succinyltransferase [Lachnospiraceae bacterium]